MAKKRVQAHVLEKVIGTFMAMFGIAAIYILFTALKMGKPDAIVAIVEVLIIVVLSILAQTYVIIRMYDMLQQIKK